MSERMRKINSVIMHELSALMARDVDFKNGVFVTISKVDTSRDLRYTRIFVRVFPQSEIDYGLKTLAHEKNTLQKALHKKLHLKILPKITFVHDQTGDNVDALEKLSL